MKTIKNIFNYIFVDGLSGMALGLFATLIIGTIIEQIGGFINNSIGTYLIAVAAVAKSLTGAGIGAGMAFKYKCSPLAGVSAAVAGMVGAFAPKIIAGSVLTESGMLYSGPGDPLCAFIAAFFAVQAGLLVGGKTKLDIIVTPAVSIITGCAAGLFIGPPVSNVTTYIGEVINWGMERQPVVMGIVVSVVMGICLTLPISSAALGIILGLSGIAGGAAVVGCSANMIGFAVASYRENKFGGLVAQGIGTSMLQMPNIVKHPQIWIPPIVASAVLGPISSAVLGMTCHASGSGMGTSGLVGQFMTYASMTESGTDPAIVLVEIAVMHFIAPALISFAVSEFMRKKKLISFGDMELKNMD
ncbi:MAG: PTS sugar transporter subunit IIC [Clostridia bacterium]|nr:PTS sugar transporter subunit IIC [Clostridia bacterium]MBR3819913.1 PTS sugar transporter subunit IIC [Clostridia bacterium]